MTLTEFLHGTYVPLRLRGRSPRSVQLLAIAERRFSEHLGRPATLADLQDLVLARFLTARAAQVGPHSVERERTGLLAMWRLAADLGLVKGRPTIGPTPLPRRNPTAWTQEEIERLLAAADGLGYYVGPVPARIWFRALVSLLWESAERISAVLAVEAADLVGTTLVMRAETRKGKRSDRVVQLSASTAALLVKAHDPARPELLHWPACRGTLYNRWHALARAAGLDAKRSCFHQVRRSVATAYLAAGGNPTALLDHADARTTKAYIDRRLVPALPSPADVVPLRRQPPPT